MAKHLNEELASMTYDKLIAGVAPAAIVESGKLRKLSTAATYPRGTVLAKSDIDNKLVILGTAAQQAVEAAAAVYTITSDVAIAAGKTYYTRSGSEGSYVYTAVASPLVADIATYYELTTAAVAAQDAEALTPDCILCDETAVGTAADVIAAVYTAGCFNESAITVADAYSMTEADKDKLRERGLYLRTIFE